MRTTDMRRRLTARALPESPPRMMDRLTRSFGLSRGLFSSPLPDPEWIYWSWPAYRAFVGGGLVDLRVMPEVVGGDMHPAVLGRAKLLGVVNSSFPIVSPAPRVFPRGRTICRLFRVY